MAYTLTEDELTLHLIATGLITLSQRTAQGQQLYPYPDQLQRGLNRLTLAALRRAKRAPQGVPELIAWCHKPLGEWPLSLPDGTLEGDETLLIDQQVSSTCDDWACANPDVEAELSEGRLIRQVFEICSQANDQLGYRSFRSLLIEQPTMTALELQQACIDPQLLRLSDVLREAYQEAPGGWAINGMFRCCAHCGNLLIPLSNNKYICETERCRYQRSSLLGREIPSNHHPVWLIRGLRRFVASPGRAELDLAKSLEALGLAVELWPALDRYDLRISFNNGMVWAVDVKDWSNPFLLGRKLEAIPREPTWDKAFIVFPKYRLDQRKDYLRALKQAAPKQHFEIASTQQLISKAKQELKRL